MNIKALCKPLSTDEIDFRVQSINNGGYATILAYKDARVDQNRLDDVVGALNWKREHTNGNHNCIVSIWCGEKQQWVSKEDTGTESKTESEKGLASDSFKRACFNWGIGRELYDYPVISIKLKPNEVRDQNGKKYASYELKLREWVWESAFAEDGKLAYLVAFDNFGNLRFSWGDPPKSELMQVISDGDELAMVAYWCGLDHEQQAAQWRTLDKDAQNYLKGILKTADQG